MPYRILLSLVLAGLALAPAAKADFTYTFERTSSNPYSFSFSFPTLLTSTQDPFGPLPFTVQGVTFQDSFLVPQVGWVGFSAIANSINVIGNGGAVHFANTSNGMVLLFPSFTAPGVYENPFIIFNTTSLPTLQRLTITDTSLSAVPEPGTVVLLGGACVMLALVTALRKRFRASS